MPVGPNAIYDLEVDILECIRAELEELEQPMPCRICVSPGETVWDECGNGGQLIAGTFDTYYSNAFPTDISQDASSATATNCGPGMLVASITFSLMRCAPAPKGNPPRPPSCEELAATSLMITRDSYAMRNGALCCLREKKRTFDIVDYRMGHTLAEGPEGGCVGNELTILVAFANA